MSSIRRKITSNIVYLAGGQGVSWILASVYILVVPTYLGPENLGILTLVGSISSIIVVFATLGTRVFILREVARSPERARSLVGPAILMYMLLAFFCWLVAGFFINLSNNSETLKLVLYLSGAANILGMTTIPLRAALQGMDKMHYTLFETVLDKGLNTLLALGVVALNLGLLVLVSINLVTVLPVVALYVWAFFRHHRTSFRPTIKIYQELVRGGIFLLISEISFNIYLYLDTIILSTLTDEKTVGYYSVPVKLFGSLLIAPVIIGQAILPTLSRLAVNQDDESNSATVSRNLLSFLICISLPVAVGTTVMAEPFINLIYFGKFNPSIPIMILLGWTTIPTYLGIGLGQILISQDRQSKWTVLMVMAIFVNGALNFVLIPYFQGTANNGGIGAGISQLVTEILIGIFGINMVAKDIINHQLVIGVLKSTLAAAVMGFIIWPIRELALPIPVILGVLVYGVLAIILFGLTGPIKQFLLKVRSEQIRATK